MTGPIDDLEEGEIEVSESEIPVPIHKSKKQKTNVSIIEEMEELKPEIEININSDDEDDAYKEFITTVKKESLRKPFIFTSKIPSEYRVPPSAASSCCPSWQYALKSSAVDQIPESFSFLQTYFKLKEQYQKSKPIHSSLPGDFSRFLNFSQQKALNQIQIYNQQLLQSLQMTQKMAISLFTLFIVLDPLLSAEEIFILRSLGKSLIQLSSQYSSNSIETLWILILLDILRQDFGQKDLFLSQ